MKKCDIKGIVEFEMALDDELNDWESFQSLKCEMDGREVYDW